METIEAELNIPSVNMSAGFNMSLEEYLVRSRGPKHLDMDIVIPLTIVYVVIFVTGVAGNLSVCAVIVRNSSMHTATNYYLFSLAVSDLTLLILGLPNDLSVYWHQYPWVLGLGLCKFRALVSEMMSYTSVLTIVAFSMERYLAICHPLHHYAMSGLRRAVKIITVLWIVSLASAAPFAVYTTIDYLEYPPGSGQIVAESAFCGMFDSNLPSNWPIYEISSFLFFMLPMLVIIVLYVRMGIKIRKRTGKHSLGKKVEGSVHETKLSNSRKAIIRMLSAVVIAFFLCWAPFHAQRLLYLYAKDSPNFPEINEWMYYITGCFYYFSSTVNPILYNVMSAKYRMAFKETLCGANSQKYNDQHSINESNTYNGSMIHRTRSSRSFRNTIKRNNSPRVQKICEKDEMNRDTNCDPNKNLESENLLTKFPNRTDVIVIAVDNNSSNNWWTKNVPKVKNEVCKEDQIKDKTQQNGTKILKTEITQKDKKPDDFESTL